MKNETKPSFETMQKWRSIVQNAATLGAAVEALKAAGLRGEGRAIKFVAEDGEHGGKLYNQWRTQPPEQSTSGKSRMQHFRIVG